MLEARKDCAAIVCNNPIELLKAIKELIHSPICAKYKYATLTNTFERLLNIKQQENEGLCHPHQAFPSWHQAPPNLF